MINDEAAYSARAIGLADIMFSHFQSTPFRWFDTIPWWASISFHDHPTPLLFLIQHFFFLFSDSGFFARLPYTLMSLGTIVTTYFLVLQLFKDNKEKKQIAIYTALALAIGNGLIWVARIPHLEGGVLFFLSVALLFFVKFVDNKKHWLGFGVALGLAMLTKYNALFILPTIFFYLIFFQRKTFGNIKLWSSAIVVLAMTTPIIVFNYMLYKTQGHFDLQLSRLFGQETPWILSGAQTDVGNFLNGIWGVATMNSIPYFALAIVGLWFATKANKRVWLINFYFVFLLLFIFAIGADNRFLIFATVPLAIGLGYFVTRIMNYELRIMDRQPRKKLFLRFLLGSLFFYLLFFTIFNQHSFQKDIRPDSLIGSRHHSRNFGISQLDQFLTNYLTDLEENENLKTFNAGKGNKVKKSSLAKYNDSPNIVDSYLDLNHILIYDDAIIWFPRPWVFDRRTFYKNYPIYSPQFLSQLEKIFGSSDQAKTYHLIKAADDTLHDPNIQSDGIAKSMEQFMVAKGVVPRLVYTSRGEVAFRIYRYEGVFGFGTN
jgi:hypothetical protein